jgi:hypothetical protein
VTFLPPPLTPADADLQEFAFMPLDVGRLRDSDLAALSSGDEFRCAVLLWCASWHQLPAGSLPDDDKVLSQLAGFGRVVKEWKKCRDGALRNWIKCDDGRLYHPVVAEKVNEAWAARVKYAENKKAERARKAEERRLKKLAEESVRHSDIPIDTANLSAGQTENVRRTGEGLPPENALTVDSGQWTVDSGQLTSKASSGGEITDHGREGMQGAAPPLSEEAVNRMSAMLRQLGVEDALVTHPAVQFWTAQGVSVQMLEAAVATARRRKGKGNIPANYLFRIVHDLLNPPALPTVTDGANEPRSWQASAKGIERKGRSVGLEQLPGELVRDYAVRIQAEINNRPGAAA